MRPNELCSREHNSQKERVERLLLQACLLEARSISPRIEISHGGFAFRKLEQGGFKRVLKISAEEIFIQFPQTMARQDAGR